MARKAPVESSCPSDETVALFLEGKLSGDQESAIRRHVDGCTRCRQMLAGLVGSAHEPVREASKKKRTARTLAIGDVVRRRYRIDALVGEGGMATVFRAHHLGLGRPVALKIMRTEFLEDDDAARRFAHEARAAAAIDHPNAVRILDIDELEGSGAPFIVMEYLEGCDLGAIGARESPLDVGRVIRYILQAAAAVSAGHALRIVHRDLKPQNLFVTKADIVKVVDFGLAKTLSLTTAVSGSQQTQTSMLLGSPHYMSPEQVRSSRTVDERTDIWALGATMFHLVTGRTPFVAPNLYLLCARVLSDEPPSMLRLRSDVPPSLDAVVKRCMKKAPAERFATIDELSHALEATSRGEVVLAAPPRAREEHLPAIAPQPIEEAVLVDEDDTQRMSPAETVTHHGRAESFDIPESADNEDLPTTRRRP